MVVKIEKALGPFWRWKLNLGVGECEVGCLFCYNRRWEWSTEPWKIKDFDERQTDNQFAGFKWFPGKSKQYDGQHDIMMCSAGDPFSESNYKLAFDVLRIAAQYPEVGDHLRILTKRSAFTDYGWSILPKNALYGVTICTLDDAVASATMPNASKAGELLWHLYIASKQYLRTWISVEPMLKGMNLVDLMEMIYPEHEIETIEEIWVGRLNYGFGCEDYAMPDDEIIKQVKEVVDSYDIKIYIKRELAGKLTPDDGIIYRDTMERLQ